MPCSDVFIVIASISAQPACKYDIYIHMCSCCCSRLRAAAIIRRFHLRRLLRARRRVIRQIIREERQIEFVRRGGHVQTLYMIGTHARMLSEAMEVRFGRVAYI